MKEKSFLAYSIDIKKHQAEIETFKTLSITEQKQHLCQILDKNQLYVNLSDMEDTRFACSEQEKAFNEEFYVLNEFIFKIK